MNVKHKYLIIGMLVGAILTMGVDVLTGPDVKVEQVEKLVSNSNNNTITGYPIPMNMSFAGEAVPLDRFSVRERLEREMLVNAFWHSNSVIMIKRANKWLPMIDSVLRANQIPVDFKYLCVAESGLDNVISPSNAVGFWQFLKGTAGDFGLIVNKEIDQRYDPVLATEAACKYLKQAYQKFGSWTMVAASYNLGMNGASKIIDKQKPETYYDMFMSEEPSRYVFRILALKHLLEDPSRFGFEIPEEGLYQMPKTRNTRLTSSIEDLHEFAAENGTSYAQLRELNPWIRGYKLGQVNGRTLEIRLPQE